MSSGGADGRKQAMTDMYSMVDLSKKRKNRELAKMGVKVESDTDSEDKAVLDSSSTAQPIDQKM